MLLPIVGGGQIVPDLTMKNFPVTTEPPRIKK